MVCCGEQVLATTTLLRDGTIVDGRGTTAFEGHLLIEDDRIRDVLRRGEELPSADVTIEAEGCVISPGFIDMHSHADWLLPQEDHAENMRVFVEQGVTTVVAGNCGFSPAPLSSESSRLLDASLGGLIADKPLDYSWRSMEAFLDRLERARPLLNIAELVGHATVRLATAETRRGQMTPDETTRCLQEVRRSLEEGACGLSFGLGYDPGMYSPLEELEAFCRVAAEADKPVTVHLKALSRLSPTYPATTFKAHNLLALREMIEVARKVGAKLQLSHFIFVGRRSWPTAEKAIGMVEQARREGVDLMIDAFPYTCGNTTVNVLLPYWFLAMDTDRYGSRWVRARLKAELEIGFALVGFSYKDFQVMDAAIQDTEELNGLTVDQIARRWRMSPFNAMLALSEQSGGEASVLFHAYSGEPGQEEVLEAVLSHDLCLFETDALMKRRGYPNPAALGTFPRILGPFVRDRKLFGLENAIQRMTLASARRFGLDDRGVLDEGKAADVVVFDPQKVSDSPSSGAQPAGHPRGIRDVFINGAHVVQGGHLVEGPRAGKVLRTH
jgi:N-acyl-D-amino-acid deacylase